METFIYAIYWIFAALLGVIAIIDFRSHKIHPELLYTMCFIALIKTILEIIYNDMYFTSLWAALISATVTTLVFGAMYRFSHGIGLGDVKLMAVVGFFYSLKGIFAIVVFSMMMVAIAGIGMIIKSRKNLKAELPFAPFVAIAAILREVIILADKI